MLFDDTTPKAGSSLPIFKEPERDDKRFSYMYISGENICNVVFDEAPAVDLTNDEVLNPKEIEKIEREVAKAQSEASAAPQGNSG